MFLCYDAIANCDVVSTDPRLCVPGVTGVCICITRCIQTGGTAAAALRDDLCIRIAWWEESRCDCKVPIRLKVIACFLYMEGVLTAGHKGFVWLPELESTRTSVTPMS